MIAIFLELKYGSYAWRHGKNAYPVAIITIQNKYSSYIALVLMFENSLYMYFVDLEPYWHI